MKECWINVYELANGDIRYGYCYRHKLGRISSKQKLLYRIRVRLK
jgi:hypothetical protein